MTICPFDMIEDWVYKLVMCVWGHKCNQWISTKEAKCIYKFAKTYLFECFGAHLISHRTLMQIECWYY